MGGDPADERWMRLSLSLGRRGLGRTWPNPAVGCVIVRDGRVVGRGWTQPGGRPHGEVMALAQAGKAARGATAYVTLEPCAHHGKTPPCADALIDAGIARVVCAMQDPDPRVQGKGIERMRSAGLRVETGCLTDAARQDHTGFLRRVTDGRPMVTLKLATSFDGRIATASGESRWITGPDARRQVHFLRATHDAVMVGGGTARADDPMLTVRGLGMSWQPVRVVCDTRLSVDPSGRLGRSARDVPLWMCHGSDAPARARENWHATGAALIECRAGADGLDIVDVLHRLGQRGLTRLFCEGGGQLAASLLAEDMVDRMVGFTAGLVLGADGRPAIGALPGMSLDEHHRFSLTRVHVVGPDVMHVWSRRQGG